MHVIAECMYDAGVKSHFSARVDLHQGQGLPEVSTES